MLIDRIKKSWNQNCSFIHKDIEKNNVFTENKVGMYRDINFEYIKKDIAQNCKKIKNRFRKYVYWQDNYIVSIIALIKE